MLAHVHEYLLRGWPSDDKSPDLALTVCGKINWVYRMAVCFGVLDLSSLTKVVNG